MIPDTKNGLPAMACVSAMQKAIRRGLEREAMEFAVELMHTSKAFHSMVCNRLEVICHEDLDTLAAPMGRAVRRDGARAVKGALRKSIGEARLMVGNCDPHHVPVAEVPRWLSLRCGHRAAVAAWRISRRKSRTGPTISTRWRASWAVVSTTSARKARGWSRRRPTTIPTRTKPTGCGRSSSRASKLDGYRLSPYHSTFLPIPSPQRYCHARPAAREFAARAGCDACAAGELQRVLSVDRQRDGQAARVFPCSLSLFTPFSAVRPPAK